MVDTLVPDARWTYAIEIKPGDTVWFWRKYGDQRYGALVIDTTEPFPKGSPLPQVTIIFREADLDTHQYYIDDLVQLTRGTGPVPKESSTLKNLGALPELDIDSSNRGW